MGLSAGSLACRVVSLLESVEAGAATPGRARALFFFLAGSLLLAKLGASHLSNYDDCFYAQRAKEMLFHGHWITPHFDGVPQVDNPPLFQWLVAFSFALFGVTNYAAILPSALSGVLCVVLVHRLAQDLELDRFVAWSAAFVLLGTQYFTKFARHAMTDVFLTLLLLLALHAYLEALGGKRRSFLWFGLWTGAGILTKSVLGLFPLGIAVLHLLWTGRARLLFDPYFLGGWALALTTGGWWFVYEAVARPEAFAGKWHWMLWTRTLGGVRDPWWHGLDYGVSLAKIYWPWLPLALAGAGIVLWRALASRTPPATTADRAPSPPIARFLVAWLLVVVGPLSFAHEKKLWYVMGVFPCLALLSAIGAARWVRRDAVRRRVMGGGFALLLVAALVVQWSPLRLSRDRRPDLQRMALAARTVVPAGQRVLNLDADYYSFNPQFLFYSDHGLTHPLRDPAKLRQGLEGGGYALLTRSGYESTVGADSARYPIAVQSGDWMLVKAAPREPVLLAPTRSGE